MIKHHRIQQPYACRLKKTAYQTLEIWDLYLFRYKGPLYLLKLHTVMLEHGDTAGSFYRSPKCLAFTDIDAALLDSRRRLVEEPSLFIVLYAAFPVTPAVTNNQHRLR